MFQCCSCFMFWCFGWRHCGISAPWPGIKPAPIHTGKRSINHWTAREIPKESQRVQLRLPLLPTQSLSSAPNKLRTQLGPFQINSDWNRDQSKRFWKTIACCRKWVVIKSIKHQSYEPLPDTEITLSYWTLLWNEIPLLPTPLHWIKIHSELWRAKSSARHRRETQRWNDRKMGPRPQRAEKGVVEGRSVKSNFSL